MGEKPSFYYPPTKKREAHRMCMSGQRRAVTEAYDLLVPGGDESVSQILDRAAHAERRLRSGADIPKHNLISYAVVKLYMDDILGDFVDPEGNYTLKTFRGNTVTCNIFHDIEADREIF